MHIQGHHLGSALRATEGQGAAVKHYRLHDVPEDLAASHERGQNLSAYRELKEPKDVREFHQFVLKQKRSKFEKQLRDCEKRE